LNHALTAAVAAMLFTGSAFSEPEHAPRDDDRAPAEDREKIRAYHKSVRGQFDADQDGKLNESEVAAYQNEMSSGAFPKPPEVGGRIPKQLEKYDTDTDGKLNEDERVAIAVDAASGKLPKPDGRRGGHRGPPPELAAKYDTDGDGKLNDTERSQLRADFESGKIPKPERGGDEGRRKHGGQGRGGHHGPPPEIVEKYDTNNDGELDETERAALKADRKSGKLPKRERGGQQD
jgi:hypothetical protein